MQKKVQHGFMIKVLEIIGLEGIYLNIETVNDKPIALNREKLTAIP